MDSMAIVFCKENNILIIVFNFLVLGNICKVVMGEKIGIIVGGFYEFKRSWRENVKSYWSD